MDCINTKCCSSTPTIDIIPIGNIMSGRLGAFSKKCVTTYEENCALYREWGTVNDGDTVVYHHRNTGITT